LGSCEACLAVVRRPIVGTVWSERRRTQAASNYLKKNSSAS
jgi:hypothetical protein